MSPFVPPLNGVSAADNGTPVDFSKSSFGAKNCIRQFGVEQGEKRARCEGKLTPIYRTRDGVNRQFDHGQVNNPKTDQLAAQPSKEAGPGQT